MDTVLENRARIVFDYNDPIDTPLIFNTIDTDPPTSRVAALPENSENEFDVAWSGVDSGASITGTDVDLSVNAGPWTLWQSGATQASGKFIGRLGETYAFYSVAKDGAGNTEPAPASPDTQTKVTTTPNGPLLITHAGLSAEGRFTLSWTATAGKTYRVDWIEDLSEPTWTAATGGSQIDQGRGTFTDPETSGRARYYRIVELP